MLVVSQSYVLEYPPLEHPHVKLVGLGYAILGASGAPEIAEAAPRSGSYCGSLFLDLLSRELVPARLAAHPVHPNQQA
jgi:hypothetical protein